MSHCLAALNLLTHRLLCMNESWLARFVIGMSLLTVATSCDNHGVEPATHKLRRGIGGEPSTLDPISAADNFSFEVLRDIYEGLTTDGPNGEVLPGVAASWTVNVTGTEYTFYLRNDARWSDGKPVRAQDFVNAWRLVVNPAQASPVADDLRVIAGAAAIIGGQATPSTLGAFALSDTVLLVKLERPAPYLLQLLTQSAAYPTHPASVRANITPKVWISNGPYVVTAWFPGTKIDLRKNPMYWDKKHVQIEQVEYQVADDNSQYARYRAAQLEMTDNVPINAIATIRETNPGELVIAPFLATAYYGLNLAKDPFAGNIELRQAVAMAIDRRNLVKSMASGQTGAYGFVPPGTWNYSPQSWYWNDLKDSERIAEARRLYAKAGYSKTNPLHLRLLYNSNPVIKSTAIIIAQMWRETLGIESVLIEEEYRVFLQTRHDKTKWEVARLGWTADYDDASNFLDIFRQHSSNNDSGYSDPLFDALSDAAAQASDSQERRAMLEASERQMLAQYPVVPLYYYVSRRLVKPKVHGVQLNPLNRISSKLLSISGG